MKTFAPSGGGRRFYDAQSDAGGSGGRPASGDGDPNNAGQKMFDTGFGKGIDKGRIEGQEALLAELGVKSPAELKALADRAKAADAAALKAAEEQGQFKTLYEQEKAARAKDAADIAELRRQVTQYEATQKAELTTLTAKMSAEQKALLDGLPLDRQVALARVLSAAASAPVGAAAGRGTAPAGDANAKLAAYAKKGVANLTKDERADMNALLAEVDK